MTCKNQKTIVFGVALLSMLVSVSGINIAQAQTQEEEQQIGFKYEEFPSLQYVPGMPIAAQGIIDCVSYVNTAARCTGSGTGIGDDVRLTYPYGNYWYNHMCNGGTVPCVTVFWKAEGYNRSIYDPVADQTYLWSYATVFSCSQTWGCTNSGFWTTLDQSPLIVIRDAPMYDPITTYTQLNYQTITGDWATITIAQDLALGFG